MHPVTIWTFAGPFSLPRIAARVVLPDTRRRYKSDTTACDLLFRPLPMRSKTQISRCYTPAMPNQQSHPQPPAAAENRHSVRPIGIVRSPIKSPQDDCWANIVSRIDLDPETFTPECTQGLSEFSHLEIVFLFHLVNPDSVHRGSRHPRGNTDWPKVGIFAQRAKDRPNRIGVSFCKIESVNGLQIEVRELDAIDGTPVVDIKPYMAEFAPRGEIRQPNWSRQLMAGYFEPQR
jgi:tRNA-Thr(GGU) m(6)t(6)A37 methyltransferase TsaA